MDSLRFLIVDDDAVDRRSVRRAFGGSGFADGAELVEAETGGEALALMQGQSWSCVLLDYRLPDIDGSELLACLADTAGEVGVPIVMLTGANDVDTAVEVMRLGARDYLVKDVEGRYRALIVPVVQRVIQNEEIRRARQRAEGALRMAEMRYRGLVEQIPAISYIATLEARPHFLFVSPQASLLGREASDWVADADLFWTHVHPDDLSALQSEWQRFADGGSLDREFRFIRDDGRMLWLRSQATVIGTGAEAFAQGVLTDVTASKAAEAELRAHRDQLEALVAARTAELRSAVQRLRDDVVARQHVEQQLARQKAVLQLALDAANMGAWECDVVTGSVAYSAGLEKLYGLSPQQRIVDLQACLDLVHAEDREAVARQFDTAIAADERMGRMEFRVAGADGEARRIARRFRIEPDEHGQALRAIGIDIDMSAEHELRALLERSNRELERFACTVAHDLKSPLFAVTLAGEILSRSAASRLDAAERKRLDSMLRAAGQMSQVIDGVLESARASQSTQREPVDLAGAFEECLLRLGPEIEGAAAALTSDQLPCVQGNRVLLTQVLQNLLANALKYRAQRPLRIHLAARRSGEEWIVSLRDNGIGIPPERQARLFEAFTRAHAEAGYPGLGLGLALVKDAVEHHRGRVWLDSTPDEGSTFYFSLPQHAAGSDSAGRSRPDPARGRVCLSAPLSSA